MAFEEDLAEFYDAEEFAEAITHNGNSIDVIFSEDRQEIDGIYINNTFFTAPASSVSSMIKGDAIIRGPKKYRIKNISDHSIDTKIKLIELEYYGGVI